MNSNKKFSKNIIKMGILKNAKFLGWAVEKQNDGSYVLRKKVCNLSNDEKTTDSILDTLFNVHVSMIL